MVERMYFLSFRVKGLTKRNTHRRPSYLGVESNSQRVRIISHEGTASANPHFTGNDAAATLEPGNLLNKNRLDEWI